MSAEQKSLGDSGAPGEFQIPPGFLPANRRSETLERHKRRPYLDEIGRPELKEVLTPNTPWVSVSMEVGVDRLPFTGGLGALEGDKLLQAKKSGIPYIALTLAYSQRWTQSLENYSQIENYETVTPEDLGLKRIGKTSIKIIGWQGEEIVKKVDICQKSFGSAQVLALHTPDLREVYYGSNDSEHRLFQQVVLGFGGQKALDSLGLSPSMIQVNESAPVFSAIAYLDKLVQEGMVFDEAIQATRDKTLFTNHTLVPSAVSNYSKEYFERLVIPNIESEDVKSWIRGVLEQKGDQLSILAFELSGRQNGVSKLHAEIASASYKKLDGSSVPFEANTNGIYIGRWAHPGFLTNLLKMGVVDGHFRKTEQADEIIENMDWRERLRVKRQAKNDLVSYLKRREDQNGEAIGIPNESKIAFWSRRMASYKQPFLLFENPDQLARILEEEDIHMVMAGKAHPTDIGMKEELKKKLLEIEGHPILKQRVHFVQDYDAELARHLVGGADIGINTPIKGKEACGTSPFKMIVNDTIVISTEDGGLADKKPAPYIVIEGDDIYDKLRQASDEVGNPFLRTRRVRNQLKGYIDTIPSGDMLERYIKLGYRQKLPLAA